MRFSRTDLEVLEHAYPKTRFRGKPGMTQSFYGGNNLLKRLFYYFGLMDKRTTTYRYSVRVKGGMAQKDIYEGECHVTYAGREGDNFGVRREPTYWHNGIAYTLERTNKLAIDRPTVTIAIPADRLGINEKAATPAAADFCLRAITPYFDDINALYHNRSRPDKDNGKFLIHQPGQKVLLRNAAYFAMQAAKDYEELGRNEIRENPEADALPDIFCLMVRMEVQLPFGLLDRASTMLCKQMPKAVGLFIGEFKRNAAALADCLKLEATQHAIRNHLRTSQYCAFIANGSILPRAKGGDLPAENAVLFVSPPAHEIEIAGIRGMGIARGITVITGGGYSGKSTVLNAVSAGIYNHIAGDGRELCITDDTAVTITAEDGRAISNVNISPFIKWIPGSDPTDFSTTHASGSTSQGANIMEAVAAGSRLLLIDEDRSATNFMIRDAVMKQFIQKEPITPFTDRVGELSASGISTILVIGGSGEYLGVAHNTFMMDEFVMSEATEQAKTLVPPPTDLPATADWTCRTVIQSGFSSYPKGASREKLGVTDTGFIIIGDERIDIRSLHDIATPAQANALAFMLRYLSKGATGLDELQAMALAMRGLSPVNADKRNIDVQAQIAEMYDKITTKGEGEGLNLVDTGFFTTMDRTLELPRQFELMAAINRMRHLSV